MLNNNCPFESFKFKLFCFAIDMLAANTCMVIGYVMYISGQKNHKAEIELIGELLMQNTPDTFAWMSGFMNVMLILAFIFDGLIISTKKNLYSRMFLNNSLVNNNTTPTVTANTNYGSIALAISP